ncbi:MAG: TetR/AcrR family transcriptional regulator [Cyclobacteriaceae bacterium]
MAEIKVSDDKLISGFLEVFRKVGYEGASLEELARASGLKKSSLYHRFPGGKKQMAREVLEFSNRRRYEIVMKTLRAEGDPQIRLSSVLKNLNELYSGGTNTCILRALSMNTGLDLFFELIQGAFEDLISGFAKNIEDFGIDKEDARKRAEDIVIKIQGGLVVAKGTGRTEIFARVLGDIETSFNH